MIQPRQATKAEMEYRTDLVFGHIVAGRTRAFILKWVEEQHPEWQISPRQIDRLIKAAKDRIMELGQPVREAEYARALARMHQVYGLALARKEYFAAIKAQQEINKIIGLYAPTRLEHSGPDGRPIQTQDMPVDLSKLTDEELAELERIHAKLTEPPATQ